MLFDVPDQELRVRRRQQKIYPNEDFRQDRRIGTVVIFAAPVVGYLGNRAFTVVIELHSDRK